MLNRAKFLVWPRSLPLWMMAGFLSVGALASVEHETPLVGLIIVLGPLGWLRLVPLGGIPTAAGWFAALVACLFLGASFLNFRRSSAGRRIAVIVTGVLWLGMGIAAALSWVALSAKG